ncbi:uncharacterized protein LOC118213757 isoform X5 [Anguilla anguilla]|uniref:uncharacterized protein LOC118213757 isoform X5 n=1 Tax=Anguilla anguilla TaxID=7936 RepID=UPI0015B168C2|nr:uncharacterized protein LOC118213757 isoform X5 [Anguilla anguilla]
MDRTAMLTSKLKVVFLLNVLASSILAAGDEVGLYGKDGGEITLTPDPFSGPLERIVWIHGGDKAIEWEGGLPEAYRQFRGSTSLNKITGEMTITNLDSRFNGVYSSDVNGIQATKKWKLTVLGDEVYGKKGGEITLSPGSLSGSLTRIVWKHGGDKAIELEGGITDAYRQFKGSTSLNKITGEMTITNLDSTFNGVYSSDVNGIQATKKWKLTVLGDEVGLYGKDGGEITLTPGPFSGPLERIVWKHGGDKAIEWEGGITDAYRQFRGSTSLNETTGEMRITNLDSTFNGVYSSDVNGIQATKKWKLTVLGDEVGLYGKDGGEITLTPGPFSGPLERIVWKHGGDKAIEWEGGITDAYRQFRGSTSLNETTGEMRITNLDSTFNGVYSSDVNGIQATKKWKLTVLGDEVYGKDGGEITLTPDPFSGPLYRIVWNRGGDKAIELEGGITDAYRQFKDSTFLDTETGEMTITKLDSTFNGVYSSDVNGIQATKKWKLTVLDPVSKPIIDMKCTKSMCILSCENTATVKVQCAWRKGEEELRQSDGTLKLEKTDDKVGKAYICNCSNPVSFAVSDPVVPFLPGDEVYGKKGGEITLSPGSLSGSLTRIVWKHGDDKAIEWDGGITDAFRQFNGSTTVNEKTGEMRITKLNSTFNGVYSSDVNGIQATIKWKLTVLGDEVYGKKGGEITLSPGSLSGPLERIVWKHGDDKAIEWEAGQTVAYRQFKGSTTLDAKTGEMTITKLDSRFIGLYSSDVNGVQATKRWTLTLLDPVSKPIIVKNCNESTCVLTCKSNATFKVQYAWRKGEEELQKYDRTLELEKTDDTVGKAYICNFSNPVSFAESDQVVPFPPDPVSKPIIVLENCTESMCVLTCKSNTTFKVQYAWRKGEEELQKYDRTWVLEKTDDTVGKAYTCIFSNPVSSAESDEVIPFPKPKPLVEIIVGLLSGLFILLGVIAFIKRKQLMKFVQTCRGTRVYCLGNSDADKGGAKDPEAVLLNKNAAGNQDGANETSEVPETLDNTSDDKAAPLSKYAAGNQDGANETSEAEPIYENAAGNQDGANETSEVPETLDNTIDDKAAPLNTPTNGDKPPN